jgi:hypothetical protein
MTLAPLCARWNNRAHFYSVWPIPGTGTHVLLFEICWQQFLVGVHFSSGEFAVCCGPIEITIMKRGEWCEEL